MRNKIIVYIVYSIFLFFISGWFFYEDPYAPRETLYFGRYSHNYIKVISFSLALIPSAYIAIKYLVGLFSTTTEFNIKKIVLRPKQKIFISLLFLLISLSLTDFFFNLYNVIKKNNNDALTTYHFNYGFISPTHQKLIKDIQSNQLTKDKFNVFILGESNLTGLNGKNFENRFNEYKINKDINFYNLAVPYASTVESMIKLSSIIINANPDLIFIAHGPADILRGCNDPRWNIRDFEPDYGSYLGPYKEIINNSQNPTLSQTMTTLNNKFLNKWFATLRNEKNHSIVSRATESDSTTFFKSKNSFGKNLTNIIRFTKFIKAKTVLISMPTLISKELTLKEKHSMSFRHQKCVNKNNEIPSFSLLDQTFNQFHETMLNIARREKIELINFKKSINSTQDNFNDFIHLSDKAKRIVERKIAKVIVEEYEEFRRRKDAI